MNDQELVRRILEGNASAFHLLIDRYRKLVVHMVSRVLDDHRDVEEVCQDVFVSVYEHLGSFRFQSRLSTWIATIGYRLAVNHSRKIRRKKDQVRLDDIAYKVGEPDMAVEEQDFTRFIHHLIDQMPETYRTLLTLFYLEEFSYPEIVEITGLPEGTVKNYLFRARNKLKQLIKSHFGKEIEIAGND